MCAETKKSFEYYFQTYYQQAFRYTLKKVSNVSVAEDLTMDTFVACYRKFDSFDPQKAKFATWLYVSLNNRIKNYYRDKKEIEPLDEFDSIVDGDDDEIIQSIYLSEMRLVLAEALKTLTDIQRQIVVFKYFKKMSSNDIALEIGLTAVNVRVQLTRALKKLRNYFEEKNIKWEM